MTLFNRHAGFSSMSLLLLALVVFAGAFGVYVMMNQNTTPITTEDIPLNYGPLPTEVPIPPMYPSITPVLTQSATIDTPEKVVQRYYTTYIACIKESLKTPSAKTPLESCWDKPPGVIHPSLAPKLTTAKSTDPIVCAQNYPREVFADKAKVTGNNALVTLHENFSGDYIVNIALALSSDGWHISDITCPK